MRRGINRRGHAAIEIALMSPWILLLFAGVFDFGFYAYSIISVENAARAAALQTSGAAETADSSQLACALVIDELRTANNVGSGVSCPVCSPGAACTAGPITVQATAVTGPDGLPASQVSVTYTSPQLFPLPWLMGRLTITRQVQMKV